MSKERQFLEYLDKYPFVSAVFEVGLVVVFSLLPLALAAFTNTAFRPDFGSSVYAAALYKFLAEGEFIVLTIGLCGSIFWLGLIKQTGIHQGLKIFFLFFPVLLLACCIAIFPQIKNSTLEVPAWIFWLSVVMYVSCAAVYLIVIYLDNRQNVSPTVNPSDRIDELLRAAGRKK